MPRTITVTGYRLTPASDVYDVVGAFDKAQAADPDAPILREWTERFPQFAPDLEAVGFARFLHGWKLTDPIDA